MNASKGKSRAVATGKPHRPNSVVPSDSARPTNEPDKLSGTYVVPDLDPVDPDRLESIVVPVAGLSPPRSPAPPPSTRLRSLPRVPPFEPALTHVAPDVFTHLRSTISLPASAPLSARDPRVVAPTRALQTMAERREGERARFPSHLLGSIAGTTTQAVRNMSEDERNLAHHKRKLRNRESARRSRQKRQTTLANVSKEVRELTGEVVKGLNGALEKAREGEEAGRRAAKAEEEVKGIEEELARLKEEIVEEEAVLRARNEPK